MANRQHRSSPGSPELGAVHSGPTGPPLPPGLTSSGSRNPSPSKCQSPTGHQPPLATSPTGASWADLGLKLPVTLLGCLCRTGRGRGDCWLLSRHAAQLPHGGLGSGSPVAPAALLLLHRPAGMVRVELDHLLLERLWGALLALGHRAVLLCCLGQRMSKLSACELFFLHMLTLTPGRGEAEMMGSRQQRRTRCGVAAHATHGHGGKAGQGEAAKARSQHLSVPLAPADVCEAPGKR